MTEKTSILLVDDQPEGLLALEAILQGFEQNLVKARSGREALRHILDTNFAVILLDIQMPGLDGYETAELIRQREQSRHTPIIFLTASHRSDAQVFRGYATGAVDYMLKPLEPEILRSKVKVFIELAKHTERIIELNSVLEEQKTRLEAQNEDLEAFARSVSHDLRAPLRAIVGFGEQLREECSAGLSAAGRDHLARILSASQRMTELVEDLLSLARVSRADLRRGSVKLGKLADEIAADLRKTAPERDVEFVIERDAILDADPRLMRIVLENLLGNAWKYTRKTSQAVIELGTQRGDDGNTVHYVRDNGVGFDMRYADRLFQPFSRLHSASEFEGTGVGLATVHRIIARHGGRIWAESMAGEGATFYFTLLD